MGQKLTPVSEEFLKKGQIGKKALFESKQAKSAKKDYLFDHQNIILSSELKSSILFPRLSVIKSN